VKISGTLSKLAPLLAQTSSYATGSDPDPDTVHAHLWYALQEMEYRSRLRKELAFFNRSRNRSGYFWLEHEPEQVEQEWSLAECFKDLNTNSQSTVVYINCSTGVKQEQESINFV